MENGHAERTEQEIADGLRKHGKRFGTEGVAETGVQIGLGETALTWLVEQLDLIEDEASTARKFSRAKKRRLSASTRARRLLGIEQDNDNAQEASE